ncbi:flagellar motor switch protein FliN [bacterium]|nr:MAG: flagellar motor switch protein FliN [bacterium]
MTALEGFDGLPPDSKASLPDDRDEERLRVREVQFRNVSVEVSAWIGKTKLTFGELSDLRPGKVIELDQPVGAPIEIVLNREVVLARGEVVEVGDEYGIRITEIVSDKDL